MDGMDRWKKIVIVAGGLALFFLALNYQFFWVRLRFLFSPPPPTVQEPPQATSTPAVVLGTPDEIRIPSLGIITPVIYTSGTTEAVWQEALKNGVVHYPTTPDAGEPGNIYIFGHSSNFPWVKSNYNAIFALLPKIEMGADITLTGRDGTPFTYRVIEKKVVGPKDLSVLDQRGFEKKLLTLQTSYPIGTVLKRYIVVAELVVDTVP